ncbi:MAG: PLP-dependent aminotransferase family protein [Pyrinomonadaceae bacterium]|nr:PLP-dependent aminotransferase family protein [Pyrinomonadaceae bacterium]
MPKNFNLELFLAVSLTKKTKVSLFQQIYENLRQAILSNRLQFGFRLPSTRSLAKEINVSRNTVMGVYDQLIAEGYLEGKTGAGTFVAKDFPTEIRNTKKIETLSNSKTTRTVSKRSQIFSKISSGFAPVVKKPRAFQTGFSALDEFPIEIWTRIASRKLRNIPRSHLDYCATQGYLPLREEISKYLASARGVHCQTDQVIIVAGSQQGLDLISRVLLDVDDLVWMEDPSYIGAKAAFLGAGAKLIHVPLDFEGLNVKKGNELSPNARLAYVTPSHQFPLGLVMSLSRRLELLEWANKNSAWIVEDDYDSEFRYEGKPLMALQGLDNNQRVIYSGTFSKVLFPSLRLGYLIVPIDLVDIFTKTLSFISNHAPILEQIVLTEFIREGHFGRHIRRMRNFYAERQKVLIEAIKNDLSKYLKVEKDAAGMHLVGWLKNGLDDQVIAEKALEFGVYTPPLSFYCVKNKLPAGLLLGYTGISPTEILGGVRRLRKMFETIA